MNKRIRNAQTAYNRRKSIEDAIKSAASWVRFSQAPIEDFQAEARASMDRLQMVRLPRQDRTYLEGFYQATWDSLWHFADWRMYWRGAFYYGVSSGAYPDRKAEGLHGSAQSAVMIEAGTWNEVNTEKSRYFWIGSDRPFTRKDGTESAASDRAEKVLA